MSGHRCSIGRDFGYQALKELLENSVSNRRGLALPNPYSYFGHQVGGI